jgi:hypothetical protein
MAPEVLLVEDARSRSTDRVRSLSAPIIFEGIPPTGRFPVEFAILYLAAKV